MATAINAAHPKVFVGALVGGSIAFLFSSAAIRAVGRTAGIIVQEVRRQFREHPGIMDRMERPEYGRVIDILTEGALREVVTPALLAVLAPVVIGFGINYLALGGFLAAAIITSQLMAAFMNNAGGAWERQEVHRGRPHRWQELRPTKCGGGRHRGRPVQGHGRPLAFNPLIKCMNLVSLLVLPAVITLRNNDAARYTIAAVALVIILAGVAYSKRQVASLAGPVGDPAAPEGGMPHYGGPVSQTLTLPVSGTPVPTVPANAGHGLRDARRSRAEEARWPETPGHRRVPCQGENDRQLSGQRVHGGVVRRPYPRPPQRCQ